MPSNAPRPPAVQPVPLDLALQGGGSHGAFTWGVLDRLLEDGRFVFDGVSGTSAGAMNAGVLATGLARGGAAGARTALQAFWLDIARHGRCFGSATPAPPGSGLAGFNLDSNPLFQWSSQWVKFFSPAQLNPLGLDPLREVVERHVDPDAMREGPLKLFIAATSVPTGQPEIFSGERLGIDALLASACLPQLFRPVRIDGVDYWDGGYGGNPAIWPLLYGTPTEDVLLVRINPLVRPDTPDTPMEIADRVNEITFNAGLVSEMRAIHFVKKLLKERRVDRGHYKDLRLHMVADDAALAPLHPSSKLNTDEGFLRELHRLGRAAAERFLAADAKHVGRLSTLDIEATFLNVRHAPPATG